jgi:hypothetical protein
LCTKTVHKGTLFFETTKSLFYHPFESWIKLVAHGSKTVAGVLEDNAQGVVVAPAGSEVAEYAIAPDALCKVVKNIDKDVLSVHG